MCYFRCFDLSSVPARERDNALLLQIEQWSPVLDYDSYRVWQGAHVQVWLWDKTEIETAQAAEGLKNVACIPETLFHAKAEQGLQYLELEQGVEAQVWEQGVLKHSHWWAKTPSNFQWQRFLRAHHLDLSTETAATQATTWLNKAWGKHKAPLQNSQLLREDLWVGLMASVFIGFFAWYMISINKWQNALDELEQQRLTLTNQIEPILAQRRAALDNRAVIDALLDLKPYPETLVLLQTVASKLPKQSKLIGFTYRPGQLSFTVHARKIDPRFYVNTFEKIPLFRDVTSENGANALQLVLKMQVLKHPRS